MNPAYLRKRLSKHVSAAERVAIVHLMEECGEVIQTCSKLLRLGADAYHLGDTETNGEALNREMIDVFEAHGRYESLLHARRTERV